MEKQLDYAGEQRGLVLIPIVLGVCLGYGTAALHTSRFFY